MQKQTPAPMGPEKFLRKSAGIALWGYTLLLFIMLLPAIAIKSNPGNAEPVQEALKTQTLIAFSPLFMALASMVTAIFFAVSQNKYFIAAAIAEGKAADKGNMKRLMIPFLRYKELLYLAGDTPGIKAMIVCSLLFWISYPVFGLLSPFPVYFQLAAILIFYASVKKKAGQKSGFLMRTWAMALLVVFLLSSIDGMMALKAPYTQLDKSVPATRQELDQMIYQGKDPNVEFSRLTRKFMAQDHICDKLNDARFYYVVPERFRQENQKILSSPQTREIFAPLEKMLFSGQYFNHDLTRTPYLWAQPDHTYFNRVAGRYFGAQILQALENKKPQEAMKYFRLLTAYQKNTQSGDFSYGQNMIFIQELNRTFLIGTMLGSGLLSGKDLQEIASFNRNREAQLRQALLTGLRGEAFFEKELISDMMAVYPWIQSSEYKGGQLPENKVYKFLLRGNNAFPPNTWNAVLRKKILAESAEKFNALLKKYSDNKDYRSEEGQFKGTYFVILNCKAQLTGIVGMFHAMTFARLTNLALEVENFRRRHNRLPGDLAELKIPIPCDAVTGEKITGSFSGFTVETFPGPREKGKMSMKGWQLCGSNKNYITINVPTQWPLPAPAESPARASK